MNSTPPITGRRCASAALVLICVVAVSISVRAAELAKPSASAGGADDPFLWLEDVTGDRALAWVREQNAQSTTELEAAPNFAPLRQRLLSIYDSKARIPAVESHGGLLYNFWRDEAHPRGLWRRATLDEFRKPEPAWEVVLDLDALAMVENENWVWKDAIMLHPGRERALVVLSRGGADAAVVREFDLLASQFIPDGFTLPEAKSDVAWRNRDTLYVGSYFGPDSLTSSGYPRLVKEWRRGTALAEAPVIFSGEVTDVAVGSVVVEDHGRTYEFIQRGVTFFTNRTYLRRGDTWVQIDKPDDVEVTTFTDQIVLRLRQDWTIGATTHAAGSLLATDFTAYLEGRRDFTVLFAPTARSSLDATTSTKGFLITSELDNVRSRLRAWQVADGTWNSAPLDAPAFGSVQIAGVDPDESDDYLLTSMDFLTPTTLALGAVGRAERERLKSLPEFFKADGLEIMQHEAVSRDGTRVPYFQVGRKGAPAKIPQPTLIYGYGGFEISMLPRYSAGVGSAWLETGGVFVLANIRGGGEFGPPWHNAARRENRQRAFDDFIAVAEDLIARGVTTPAHLGIQGGSNGGLLVGAVFTQRPELFGAVVCQVPLLDMRRFNQLLAGASWMDEYGNPDVPEDWAFIRRYSPYQNVSAEKKYPRVLFLTSTRDDRVHPGHARKMVAKMKAQGHDVLYYENIEGGHGGSANNQQRAMMDALAYAFLAKQLR